MVCDAIAATQADLRGRDYRSHVHHRLIHQGCASLDQTTDAAVVLRLSVRFAIAAVEREITSEILTVVHATR
jgi:hypothetical protein